MGYRKKIHDRVLNASTKKELMDAYGEWADRYDTDLIDEMGYVAPTIASTMLQDYLNDFDVRILDAGCGTGLVGECLYESGYRNIDGLDYSHDMLEKAKEKGVYRSLSQGDLTRRLDIPDDRYDAVISVGTFTCGHVGPEAFGELVRVTKRSGHICFTVREQAWEEHDYGAAAAAIEKRNAWKRVKAKDTAYIQKEGSSCKVCLYRVTA